MWTRSRFSGDALLEAHKGESSLARDPRIFLTSSACACVRTHLEYYARSPRAPQNRDVLCDIDGQWFVNYLDTILVAEDEAGPFYNELTKHKESVECRLDQHRDRPTVYSKYAWVADYHNWFCDQHELGAYRIDVGAFASQRRFIVDDL